MKGRWKLVLLIQILSIVAPSFFYSLVVIERSHAFNLGQFIEKTVKTVNKQAADTVESILNDINNTNTSNQPTQNGEYRTAIETQQELKRLGYLYDRPDGIIGPKTQAAISRFQKDTNRPVTGTPGQELLYALHSNTNHLAGKNGSENKVFSTPIGSDNRVEGDNPQLSSSSNTFQSAPQPVGEMLIYDRQISKEKQRLLIGLVLRKFPEERRNEKYLEVLVATEPEHIQSRYYGKYGWIGNNILEKEDSCKAYLYEQVEPFLDTLPKLPLQYTSVARVHLKDYSEKKGGFPIENPRFGPELLRGWVEISPRVDWDIPETIPADRTRAREFLEKLEQQGDSSKAGAVRWKDFYFTVTAQLTDITQKKSKKRPAAYAYQLQVKSLGMRLYADKGLSQLLHVFPVQQNMEEQMQLAQGSNGFSALLTPPEGMEPVELPFINGYPVFGEYLEKENYPAHTKSSQQRELDRKKEEKKITYRRNLGKYLDLLALADNPDELLVDDMGVKIEALANVKISRSKLLKKVERSLYVKAKFLGEQKRSRYLQYFPDYFHYGFANNFVGNSTFEKQDSMQQLYQALSLRELQSMGENLPRRILYVASIGLEYNPGKKGFDVDGYMDTNNLCPAANCFTNSAINVNLVEPNRVYHPIPDFFPLEESKSRVLTSRLQTKNQYRKRGAYLVWTIDLLQQKVGEPIAFQPVSVELYFDKHLTEKLYTFTMDFGRENSQGKTMIGKNDNQESSYSLLSSPPPGIKPISLPLIHGVPSYMPYERDKYGGGDKAYIWKKTVPPSFQAYITLAMLAAEPELFSFDSKQKEAVNRYWTYFLTDEQRAMFVPPKKRSSGGIIYDSYTGQMEFNDHWQGATPFEHIASAKRFYDRYKTVLSQWASQVIPESAVMQMVLPIKIGKYNFERNEFPLEGIHNPGHKIFASEYWNYQYKWHFTYQMQDHWSVNLEEAADVNRKLVEQADITYQQRYGQKRLSPKPPNYFTAYRALTVRLHPKGKSKNNGYLEVVADALYLNSLLSQKMTDFTVENVQPVMLGGKQSGLQKHGELLLPINADTINLLTMKEHGMPTGYKEWKRVMKARRWLELQQPDACREMFFKPDFPNINERTTISPEVMEQFTKWTEERIDTLDADIVLELVKRGPKPRQISTQTELYTLYRYPKAKKPDNPSQTILSVEGLEDSRHPKTMVGKGYISLVVTPDMIQAVKQHEATEMRTSFRFLRMEGGRVVLQPMSTALVYKGSVLAEKKITDQEVSEWLRVQRERKEYIMKKFRQGDHMSYQEEKELKNFVSRTELAALNEERLKANLRTTGGASAINKNRGKARKYEEKQRIEAVHERISDVSSTISNSRDCRSWKHKSKSDSTYPLTEVTRPCYFFWSESESPDFQRNHSVDWEAKGKPTDASAWYVIKADVAPEDCGKTKGKVYVNIKDFSLCREAYCFEHDMDVLYRPDEAEAVFSNTP